MKSCTFAARRLCLALSVTPLLLPGPAAWAQVPDAWAPTANAEVYSVLPEPGGTVLAGGSFYWDGAADDRPNGLMRLDAAGHVLWDFYPSIPSVGGIVQATALRSDGTLLAVGGFAALFDEPGLPPVFSFAHFAANGDLLPTYQLTAYTPTFALAPLPDGRVVIGGNFSAINGQSRSMLARFLAGGALDPAFNPGANALVFTLAAQPDGQMLVGGMFTTLGGQPRNRIGRLSPTGAVDASFNPDANEAVICLLLQPDGKILVGGAFTTLSGQTRNRLARLLPDGSLDAAFNPNLNSTVQTLALQANGKILVGGSFTAVGGAGRSRLARLHPDGTVDLGFNVGATATVYSLALQDDGKVLVGGDFTQLGGLSRMRLGRLTNPDAAGQSVALDGATLTWQRDGSLPEVWRTEAEAWSGTGFTNLGPGTRIAGGWQWTDLVLPPDTTVRLLGHAKGGRFSASTWLSEAYSGPLALTGQPASRTNLAATSATFTAGFVGSEPIAYRWLRQGQPLADGANVSGAANPNLTLASVLGADAAGYALVASNAFGALTSAVANLTVVDPAITSQPTNAAPPVGGSATFSVTAVGTAPLFYEWWKNGSPIGGATASRLSFVPVQVADGGAYSVVVANGFGSVTSSVATLTVWGPPRITVPPTSQSNYFGAPVTLSVTAAGTAPLNYQWRKNGAVISGATGSALAFPSLAHADVALYAVVVTNAYGSATSAPAAVVILNPYFLTHPRSELRETGGNVTFTASAGGLIPLHYLWRKDGLPLVGGNAPSLVLTNVQPTHAGRYDVVVTNLYGSVTSSEAVLTVNAAVADAFDAGADDAVNTLLPLPDGRVFAGGSFIKMREAYRWGLARVNEDGSPDPSFKTGIEGSVHSLALQPDGRVLVSGDFTDIVGLIRQRLARVEVDGKLDLAFVPLVNGPVHCLLPLPDGKLLIGGAFTTVTGEARNNLARLNLDGTVDTNHNAGANAQVYALARMPDGSVLVGGAFSTIAGNTRRALARLNPAGNFDGSFDAGLPVGGEVRCLALQADGRILVGGNFTQLGGQSRRNFGRLSADGGVDQAFRADTQGAVLSLVPLVDGSVLLGGAFTNVAGQPRLRLAKVSPDGNLDANFAPGANGEVRCLAGLADGRVLVGGDFSLLAGQSRLRLGRLASTGSGSQAAEFDGTELTWARKGSAPEIAAPRAEAWVGGQWTDLGVGLHMAGAWRWQAPGLPPATTFRLRGLVTGGLNNGSSWETEDSCGAPRPHDAFQFLSLAAAQHLDLAVRVAGTPPWHAQWLFNGTPLADGGSVSGAQTSILRMTVPGCADSGLFAVVLSNALGVVTSAVAQLTVRDPVIVGQPRSQTANLGSNVTFTVQARGTAPLSYQWRKAGLPLAGATLSALSFDYLQPTDLTGYDVVVAGVCGSVTSIVTHLNHGLVTSSRYVLGVVPLPDGRILAGGYFDPAGGFGRNGLGRLTSQGRLDASFIPAVNAQVYCFASQPDGAQVVAGFFANVAGHARNRLARFRPDGSLDRAYDPNANNSVLCLALQPDGKLLIGGDFIVVGGTSRSHLARLNPDGSVDASFRVDANNAVLTIALQPDGRILVGGHFTTIGGVPRSRLARLLPNGTVDEAFAPVADAQVNALLVQPDGRVLVGGDFNFIGSDHRAKLARLLPSGAVEAGFNPSARSGIYHNWINSIGLQADGKILVFGFYRVLANQLRSYLGRLHPDGTLDETFSPEASYAVYGFALQPDGRLLVGGEFTSIGGTAQARLARLDNTDVATSSLTTDGASVTWLRGGTGPEVWRTTFDLWTGTGWTNLGAGTRILGGWQLSGLSLPAEATVRAQGFAIAGDDNSSTYLVEEGFGPPVVSIPPVNRTNFLGTTAGLSAWVVGSGPVHYRWRKGGVELAEGGNVSGAGTPNLLLTDAQSADAGWYSVVATNALGSVASVEVYLAVVPLTLTGTGPGLGVATNGQFRLELGGGAAWPVSVETSTNLVQWLGVGTPWVGPEPVVLTQPFSNNVPARMYRARPVP